MRKLVEKYIRKGFVTAVQEGCLVDTAADFLAPPWPVYPGDLVLLEADAELRQARVRQVIDRHTLRLSAHIFEAVGQRYRILPGNPDLQGQVNTVATRRLVAQGLNFPEEGVREGFLARNLDTDDFAWVEAVLAPDTLLLSRHIFTEVGQRFRVYQADVVWSADLASLARRRVLLDADTTEVSTSAREFVKLKELLAYSSRSGYLLRALSFLVEGRVSAAGERGEVSLRVNGVEKGILAFTQTQYTLGTLQVEEAYPDGQLLDIELWARMVTEGTLHLRVWEIYGEVWDLE